MVDKMKKTYAQACIDIASKATEGPYYVERIDHDHGEIAYEINDKHHLVAFREGNFEQPLKAKFNAEFYAHARTDVPKLAQIILKASSDLRSIDCKDPGAQFIIDWVIRELEIIDS